MIDKDVVRIVNDWLINKKLILAADFDDTIYPHKHRNGTECLKTINLIKEAQELGIYLMIHTASDKSRHKFIKDYCLSVNLKVDSINKNPIDLPFGKEGKPFFNWQLCDRSGLKEAEEKLKQAINIIKNESFITNRFL
jgi:hypothetical protein